MRQPSLVLRASAARAAAAAAALVLSAAATTATRIPAATFTVSLTSNQTFDEQIMFFTLQGLVNRDNATLWLYTPGQIFWTDDASTYWFAQNWLGPVKNYTFTNYSTFCDMYAAVSANVKINGLALYDALEHDSTRWLAVTQSGLDDLLPVNADILADPDYTCIASLPTTVDFRKRFDTNLHAYDWGLANLMPRCNKTLIYSAGHTYNDTDGVYVNLGGDPSIDIGLDLAVSLQAFVFNLSPDTDKYPDHAAEWAKLVAALNPGKLLFGWAEPEPAMTASTSKVGGAVMCDGAPNLSFWAHVSAGYPALPYNAQSNITLDPAGYYVTFQTNEGDTPKILAALQQGMWLDPRRGSIPIAWGIDPLVASYAPGLVDFYAQTATANDTWFAATAGAGYAYPWLMAPADLALYVERAAAVTRSITPGWPARSWEVDIWDNNWLTNLSAYSAAAGDVVGMFSMQPEELPGTNNWLPNGVPVVITVKPLWYPCQDLNASTLDDMQAVMQALMAAHKPPFFFVVYGCLLDGNGNTMYDFALGMQQRLGGAGLNVVGMQDMVRLATEAGAQGQSDTERTMEGERQHDEGTESRVPDHTGGLSMNIDHPERVQPEDSGMQRGPRGGRVGRGSYRTSKPRAV